MQKILSTVALGALLATAGGLEPRFAMAESLQEAVQTAVGSHPSVTAAQDASYASGETVKEQRSAYFPELSANLTGGRMYGDNATSRGLSVTRGAGYSNLGEGSAQLTQKVYDWGETGNRVDAAKARLQASDMVVAGTREGIAMRAAQAYVALLRASQIKEAAAANLTTAQDYQTRIAAQVAEGGSDDAELNRANDFLLLAQNAVTDFDGQYQQALADYIEAVGRKPSGALARPGVVAPSATSVDAAIQSAFDSHPQAAAAKQAVVAGDHDARAESTGYLPKVNAQLSYLKRDQRDVIGGEATDARAVMKMDWAYSTGGAQIARENRAEFLRDQARAQLDETYRRIERDVRAAWSALDVSRRQLETQSGRRDATARVVDTYKTQYEGGNRSLIELMQAESQAFDARIAYDNADFSVLNAGYALSAAMGNLVAAVDRAPKVVANAAEKPVSKNVVDVAVVAPKVASAPVATVKSTPVDVAPNIPVVVATQRTIGRVSRPMLADDGSAVAQLLAQPSTKTGAQDDGQKQD